MTLPVAHLRALALGTIVAFVALILAVFAAGPAIRSLTGPPPGFTSDYTSRAAYVQAVIAQAVSMAFSFFVFGIAARKKSVNGRWRWALSAANPLTVGLAYWLVRLVRSAEWSYEYTAYHGWLLLVVLAPMVFAPCAYFGAHLARKR